jgi:integrase
VLSADEIRGLWHGLEAEPAQLASAVRLMLLTGQRRGEVLAMRWEHVNEDAGAWWWTIPAERAKNGLSHRVPLSPQAVTLVEGLRPSSADQPWVFAGRKHGQHVTNVERAIDRARARQGLTHFTPHDLRRTAASLMTSLGIPRLTVKKILNHADRDVTAIYDRHSYDSEKRVALEAWGRRVAEIVGRAERPAGVVLPLVRR